MKVPFLCIASLAMMSIDVSASTSTGETRLHWYRCNTHTHTTARPQPDANETPEFVAQWYRSHGYSCVVITDHEYLTNVTDLNRKYGADGSFLVLRGQEITQRVERPPNGVRHFHVNGIDIDEVILPPGYPASPRDMEPFQTYERNIAAIEQAGGIPQVNHPNLLWSVKLEDLLPITRPFLLEIWNGYPSSNNAGGVDEAGQVHPSVEALWDALLSRGKVVWAVAADDAHEYHTFDVRESPTPGKGWIVIQAPALTVPALTGALRAGRFYASTGVALEHYSANSEGISMQIAPTAEWSPALPSSSLYVTRFVGENGKVLAEENGVSPQYRFKGTERYVRATITDSDGRRAWTQPVFLDGRKDAAAQFLTSSSRTIGPAASPQRSPH